VEQDFARVIGAAFAQLDAVDDAGRGGDQVEVVFAGEALLDDFKMQQAKEAAAKAEACA
jgi:hypothetical protein